MRRSRTSVTIGPLLGWHLEEIVQPSFIDPAGKVVRGEIGQLYSNIRFRDEFSAPCGDAPMLYDLFDKVSVP